MNKKECNELERLRVIKKRTRKPKPTGNCIFCKSVVVENMCRMPLYCSLECRQACNKIRDSIRSCYPFEKEQQEKELKLFETQGNDYVFKTDEILNAYFGLNKYKRSHKTPEGEKE